MQTKTISKQEALAAFGGNQAALAKALRVSRQAVNKIKDGPIPERWALKLRYELRPDVFGASPDAVKAA